MKHDELNDYNLIPKVLTFFLCSFLKVGRATLVRVSMLNF